MDNENKSQIETIKWLEKNTTIYDRKTLADGSVVFKTQSGDWIVRPDQWFLQNGYPNVRTSIPMPANWNDYR